MRCVRARREGNLLNSFKHFIVNAIEYVQRCFGINDVTKRYERDVEEVKRLAAKRPTKLRMYGYESATKWER